MHANFKDITGQKFGRLTAIKWERRKGKNRTEIFWECRCDCGVIKYISANCLRCGDTRSCGCYRREVGRKSISSKRRSVLSQDPEYLLLPLSKRYTRYLTRTYIAGMLKRERSRGKSSYNKDLKVTDEMIEAKRAQLLLHRELIKAKEALNEFTNKRNQRIKTKAKKF